VLEFRIPDGEFDPYFNFRTESISDPDGEDEARVYVVSARGSISESDLTPEDAADSDSEETGDVHRLDADEVQDSFRRMESTLIAIA
jgi:hypothetical protein